MGDLGPILGILGASLGQASGGLGAVFGGLGAILRSSWTCPVKPSQSPEPPARCRTSSCHLGTSPVYSFVYVANGVLHCLPVGGSESCKHIRHRHWHSIANHLWVQCFKKHIKAENISSTNRKKKSRKSVQNPYCHPPEMTNLQVMTPTP